MSGVVLPFRRPTEARPRPQVTARPPIVVGLAQPVERREFYLFKVREAEARAAQASFPALSDKWMDIARSWQSLATFLERELRSAPP